MTRTFSTTNIVLLCWNGPDGVNGMTVYAEDFSADSRSVLNPESVCRHIDAAHIRTFHAQPGDEKSSMRLFTEWLQEVGGVVDQCTVTDGKRQL